MTYRRTDKSGRPIRVPNEPSVRAESAPKKPKKKSADIEKKKNEDEVD
jgi:hypothetical protein